MVALAGDVGEPGAEVDVLDGEAGQLAAADAGVVEEQQDGGVTAVR